MLSKQLVSQSISCQERIHGEPLRGRWALEWKVTPFPIVPLTWVLHLGQDQSRIKLGERCAGWSEGVPRFLLSLKFRLQAGRMTHRSSETGVFPLSLLRLGTTRCLTASLASNNNQECQAGKIRPR